MRKLPILAIFVIFLYSSWAPVWGSAPATWGLVLYGVSRFWGLSSRVTPPNRNPYNPYERYKPF
jgi:hypothetical protein